MKVEAHWSVFKRLYLFPYNTPRLDLLLYVIWKRIIPKYVADCDELQKGLKKLNWWKQLKKEWEKCRVGVPQKQSQVSTNLFTCSCPEGSGASFFYASIW